MLLLLLLLPLLSSYGCCWEPACVPMCACLRACPRVRLDEPAARLQARRRLAERAGRPSPPPVPAVPSHAAQPPSANQGCRSASAAVMRISGSRFRSSRARSTASAETPSHAGLGNSTSLMTMS